MACSHNIILSCTNSKEMIFHQMTSSWFKLVYECKLHHLRIGCVKPSPVLQLKSVHASTQTLNLVHSKLWPWICTCVGLIWHRSWNCISHDHLSKLQYSQQLMNHHHHQSLNREGRWGTTDDFANSFLHFSLFSTALWDLPNSRPVHSTTTTTHTFFPLPC